MITHQNILLACMLFSIACHRHVIPSSTVSFNKEIIQDVETILIGHCSLSMLQTEKYKSWYNAFYKNYTVDTAIAQQLKPILKRKTMEIFLGSWCDDSRREVPRMIKILNYIGFDTANVKLIFVDHAKQSPQHEERGKHVTNVPTFIIYDRKKSIGRIVETPRQSLEKDLLDIFEW